MNRCLNDRMLLSLLYEEEGAGAARTHLTACEMCARRSRRLESDLDAICRTLREAPPAKIDSRRFHPFDLRWLPVAVVVGLLLVLASQGAKIFRPSAPPPLSEEILSVMDEFPPELVLRNPIAAEELWAMVADAYERGSALEADWPCDWYDVPAGREAESGDAGSGDFPAVAPVCLDLNQS